MQVRWHHKDHALTPTQTRQAEAVALTQPASGFFIERIDTAEPIECLLYGPLMGDAPISEDEVFYLRRPPRRGFSRMINRPPRSLRSMVVVGCRTLTTCEIYTAYGGTAAAPREPWDLSIKDPDMYKLSVRFWSAHALAHPKKEN